MLDDFLKYFEDWDDVARNYKQLAFPITSYFTIKNEMGDNLDVKMIVPADFDPTGATKYPVLMQVYGGPNSQMASMAYNVDFMSKLATKQIITMFVDGRGTGFKGRAFRAAVSKDLGRLEVEDQIVGGK
jgi:dipeptidyl aminopeptidase/acylaminoacyl peptidase